MLGGDGTVEMGRKWAVGRDGRFVEEGLWVDRPLARIYACNNSTYQLLPLNWVKTGLLS